jgi:hypothetical protein
MMEEIKSVYQKEDGIFRRWFTDSYFDLVIWYDLKNQIIGFQLCYDIRGNEKAITYSEGVFSHNKIDQGEDNPNKNLTPILVADGIFDESIVLPKFIDSSITIDNTIREYVISKIDEYIKRRKK